MKNIFLKIFLLYYALSFSQIIIYDNESEFMQFHKGTKIIPNYLKYKDTIFIFFEANDKLKCDECKVEISRMIRYPKNGIKRIHITFNFYFREFESYHLSTPGFPDENGEYPLATLEFKKSFIRKNKDIILTYDEIMDYGPINILNMFAHKKVFVIDKDEIKNCKVIARQVYFGSSMYQE
jgi:hypothetical protein